jgi:hypothetical protein
MPIRIDEMVMTFAGRFLDRLRATKEAKKNGLNDSHENSYKRKGWQILLRTFAYLD